MMPWRFLSIVFLSMVVAACGIDDEPELSSSIAVADAMSGDTTGYARADAPRAFVFPADYGPHPDFKTEWWYYTGNLTADNGRLFGYQFTLFRTALTPPADRTDDRASDWASDQLYMGHFALSDIDREEFFAVERFSRAAAGLAGAQAEPFRVWLEDWSAGGARRDGALPMRVQAQQDGIGLDLTLSPAKPFVLQGEDGYDPKGPEPGNASYYYSFTRLATDGTVTVAGDTLDVSGLSWMDREWSTSALGEGQVGWDWFALQLSSGDDLMYYQLREADGSPSRFTNGVLVDAEGTARPFDASAVTLTVTDTWTSPVSGGTYPAGWRMQVSEIDLDLRIEPFFAEQELDVSVRYWEGAVRFEGTLRGEPVTGRGYVEMTGYGDEAGRIAS